MKATEQKAKNLLASRTTAQLIDCFELTEMMKPSMEVATTRGWIMDELESRNPKAFDAWMDSEEDSPRKFYEA